MSDMEDGQSSVFSQVEGKKGRENPCLEFPSQRDTFFFSFLRIEYLEEEVMSLVRVAGGFPVALEMGFRFRGHEVGVA